MEKMATKRQTFALFCITKRDYRTDNLTYEQASNLIKELGDPNYVKKTTGKANGMDVVKIMEEAKSAGMVALKGTRPTPMVVEEHTNMFDDSSPVKNSYFIEGGVCGFCWVNVKSNNTENRKFVAALKRVGMIGENSGTEWSKSYSGGFDYWVCEGGQSMERKIAFGKAFADVLSNYGITARVYDRMD